MISRFPDVLRPFFGKLLWRKDPSSKVIYLTFDDGPVPEVTPKVLDLLDKYQVKATFFSVGENVEKYPGLYADILNRGHRTGNHTFNHIKGYSVSDSDYLENVKKASKLIQSQLFRPPYGRITRSQISLLQSQYQIVMWDLLTHDYNPRILPQTILRKIIRLSRNGSVIVFHDSLKAKENVLNVLPFAIEYLQKEGFRFGIL